MLMLVPCDGSLGASRVCSGRQWRCWECWLKIEV